MSLIVNEQWEDLKSRLSMRTWDRIKRKAEWEQMSLSAVVKDYPSALPVHLRAAAAKCFVETRVEWLTARRRALAARLRRIDRELAKMSEGRS